MTDRPDPDVLLAEAQQQEAQQRRGKLKIFFGMSAGVGKTYAMLEEARARAAEGADVLIGYAEAHIRPDTEALLLGMEILQYKLVEYCGATLKEFHLEAALARKPTIICVDELAHSNAAGLRHAKRWQDVFELLDDGINVYSSLNVQHLQSVNDLVERITGVRVRETLPDSVLEAADEVELIDIAPEELLERFREGKIYRPEQAERASRHFFTKGNLLALREMALRKTAERVDEQMLAHRRDERSRDIVPASEKVIVCIGPSPLSAKLIRSARRLATSLHAKLLAVYVETPRSGSLGAERRARLQQNLSLADELGASTARLSGPNVADEIVAYAISNNVTKIVVGKPVRSRLHDALFGSIVDDLVRRSGEIDVYVIRGAADEDGSVRPLSDLPRPRDWRGYLSALAVTAVATLIGYPLLHLLGVANVNILMLYLLGVLWVASNHSRAAAVLASVLAVVAFDVFFVPPYGHLAVSDQQYVVTFAVMLITALVISALTQRVRSQAEASRLREQRTASLLKLSSELSVAKSIDDVLAVTSRHMADVVGKTAETLLPDSHRQLIPAAGSELAAIDAKELGVAQWAFDRGELAGRGTSTLPAAAGTYLPLKAPRGIIGVLAMRFESPRPWVGEHRQLVEALAAQAALGLERAVLAEEARLAWERVEAEFLRNTLLSAVSHDLRTPLSGIIGAASTLNQAGPPLSAADQHEMLTTVQSEAERMDRIITNLLEMTRMESGGLQLRREAVPIGEIVGAALVHLRQRSTGRSIKTALPDDLPMVLIDAVAVEQAVVNLLDNALDHTPADSPIEVHAHLNHDVVELDVSDRGPGLPSGTEKRVFEKFFRASSSAPHRGIGLGLAIVKSIAEAHGGSVSASNRPGGGATFRLLLPIARDLPNISDQS